MATKTFSIRLTAEQIKALTAAAGGRGASAFARLAVLAAVERRRMTRRQGQRDGLHQALAQVQATLIELVDRVGPSHALPSDAAKPATAPDLDTAELARLRRDIQALVGAVLRIGRNLDGEGPAAP